MRKVTITGNNRLNNSYEHLLNYLRLIQVNPPKEGDKIKLHTMLTTPGEGHSEGLEGSIESHLPELWDSQSLQAYDWYKSSENHQMWALQVSKEDLIFAAGESIDSPFVSNPLPVYAFEKI